MPTGRACAGAGTAGTTAEATIAAAAAAASAVSAVTPPWCCAATCVFGGYESSRGHTNGSLGIARASRGHTNASVAPAPRSGAGDVARTGSSAGTGRTTSGRSTERRRTRWRRRRGGDLGGRGFAERAPRRRRSGSRRRRFCQRVVIRTFFTLPSSLGFDVPWTPRGGAVHPSHGAPFSRRPLQRLDGGRFSPRTCTYPCSTGIRSRAPTSASRGGRTSPRARTARPTGSRSRAPTSEPRGGRPSPRTCTSLFPRAAVRARPLQRLEVAALRRYVHVSQFHGQPLSRAHFSTSQVAALAGVRCKTRASVCARPLQRLELSGRRHRLTRSSHVSSSPPPCSTGIRARAHFSVSGRPPRCKPDGDISRKILRSQRLQLLELSAPRRARALETRRPPATSRVPVLHCKLTYPGAARLSDSFFISRPVASTASFSSVPREAAVPRARQKVRSEDRAWRSR